MGSIKANRTSAATITYHKVPTVILINYIIISSIFVSPNNCHLSYRDLSSGNFLTISSEFQSSKPTPLLDNLFHHLPSSTNDGGQQNGGPDNRDDDERLSPTRVFVPDDSGFVANPMQFNSPIYNNLHEQAPNQLAAETSSSSGTTRYDGSAAATSSLSLSAETFDFVEQGSGEEPAPINQGPRQPIEPTRVLADGSLATPLYDGGLDSVGEANQNSINRPPELRFRLPKLTALAGQVWRYFIPYDTFQDEDGDLSGLKSTILLKNDDSLALSSNQEQQQDGQYFSWLHYDGKNQLLYAFPTDDNAGRHELLLMVEDKQGLISNETWEINVRQHQSIRAFNHLIRLEQVHWDRAKFTSIVDALGELIKRLSSRLYLDQPFASLIVQGYQVLAGSPSSFTISWSNSSIPVQPCNLSLLEQLVRPLVDLTGDPIRDADLFGYGGEQTNVTNMVPSERLIAALRPEFKPSRVSVQLLAACEAPAQESAQQQQPQQDNGTLRLNSKIGQLNWMLGEPIEFKIPSETVAFVAANGELAGQQQVQLSIHTADGLSLEKDRQYEFLEFEPETRTLFGLPYNQVDHVGQRELRLTAVHVPSGQKVREVFIINVQPQDLTTRNNRAFKMSIYFESRSGLFGPRERLELCRKIHTAFRGGVAGLHLFRESSPELVVLSVEKFSVFEAPKEATSGGNNAFPDASQASKQQIEDKYSAKVFNLTSDSQLDQQYGEMNLEQVETLAESESLLDASKYLYKLSWTNETIGQRGDCPVEVINDNIFNRLDRSLYELEASSRLVEIDERESNNNNNNNRSWQFYRRLARYFQPETGLLDLRFEPLSACFSSIEAQDVGLADLADKLDQVSAELESTLDFDQQRDDFSMASSSTSSPVAAMGLPSFREPTDFALGNQMDVSARETEYWLVMALIVVLMFVIVVFALGMHTYKKNQDKSFELQVRLAQARQNSMFLSSMVLANQLAPTDMANGHLHLSSTKSQQLIETDERNRRKPVILDSERQFLLTNGSHQASPQHQFLPGQFATLGRAGSLQASVHLAPATGLLSGSGSHQFNSSLALEANNGHQLALDRMTATPVHMQMAAYGSQQALVLMAAGQQHYELSPQRSMTLNRKGSNTSQQYPQQIVQQLNGPMHHSQSILTVTSQASQVAPLGPNLMLAQPPLGAQQQQQLVCRTPSLLAHPQQQQVPSVLPSPQHQHLTMHQQHNSASFSSSSNSGSANSSVATSARHSVISNPNYISAHKRPAVPAAGSPAVL